MRKSLRFFFLIFSFLLVQCRMATTNRGEETYEENNTFGEAGDAFGETGNAFGETLDSPEELKASRYRFLRVVALCLFFPSTFMLWGTINRRRPRFRDDLSTISPLTPERKAAMAQDRARRDLLRGLHNKKKWHEIVTKSTAFLEKKDNRTLRGLRLEANFHLRQYQQIAQDYQILIPPPQGEKYASPQEEKLYAINLLAIEHREDEYRQKCQELMDSPPNLSNKSWEIIGIAWAMVLYPNAVKDYHPVVEIAQKAVDMARRDVEESQNQYSSSEGLMLRRFNLAVSLNTLAFVLYRQGQFAETLTIVRESEALRMSLVNWILLARLAEQSGKKAESLQWRAKIKDYLQKTYALGAPDSLRFEILLFLREMFPEDLV
jgi:hypothetical protein